MLDFHNTCLFPAICPDCGEIVEVNVLEATPSCGSCGSTRVKPYHLDELRLEPGSRTVVEWRLLEHGRAVSLTDGTYLCPSCGAFELRFQEGGTLWD